MQEFAAIALRATNEVDGIAVTLDRGTRSEDLGVVDQLKRENAIGTAPDVLWVSSAQIPTLAKAGLLTNLRSFAQGTSAYRDSDYYAGPFVTLTTDPISKQPNPPTTLWGLPRDVAPIAIYLNTDLLAKAKTPDPRDLAKAGKWDWAAFEETARAARSLGNPYQGFAMNPFSGTYGSFIQSAGGSFFSADQTTCTANSVQSLSALSYLATMYQDALAIPYGEPSEQPFLAGDVAMMIDGLWESTTVRNSAKFSWGVVALPDGPKGKGNRVSWGAYVVNAQSKNQQKAWELVFALSKLTTPAIGLSARSDTASRNTLADAFGKQNASVWIDAMTNNNEADTPLWSGNSVLYSKIVDTKVAQLMRGTLKADAFAKSVCAEAQPALK
jgi:multiple sugar transport system substrate-binding protein